MTLEDRQARIARNETSFRDINERLEQGMRQVRHPPDQLEFVCECGDQDCTARVTLTLEEYEAVRRDSRHFAVAPGHVFLDAERVLSRTERFDVVQKIGDAVEVVDAADRRSLGTRGRRDGEPAP